MIQVNVKAVVVLVAAALAMPAWNGCVTKAQARAEAARAYQLGEQAGMLKVQRARGPSVTVIGEVRDPFVPWTEGLTLARAIVLAGYSGATDPRQIIIVRNNQELNIDPARLLRGEDLPVQAGDLIRLEK